MKIFVTVGTTPFDGLIRFCDKVLWRKYDFTLQIASGNYQPTNCQWFRFSEDIDDYLVGSDLVITHGGAASVFSLLRRNIPTVVVPNTERLDGHQVELCNYLARNNYARVAFSFEHDLETLIAIGQDFESDTLSDQTFFLGRELSDLISSLVKKP